MCACARACVRACVCMCVCVCVCVRLRTLCRLSQVSSASLQRVDSSPRKQAVLDTPVRKNAKIKRTVSITDSSVRAVPLPAMIPLAPASNICLQLTFHPRNSPVSNPVTRTKASSSHSHSIDQPSKAMIGRAIERFHKFENDLVDEGVDSALAHDQVCKCGCVSSRREMLWVWSDVVVMVIGLIYSRHWTQDDLEMDIHMHIRSFNFRYGDCELRPRLTFAVKTRAPASQ